MLLDNTKLREILMTHAPGVDVDGDGVFSMQWRSTETFYRMTSEYVPLDKQAAFKAELERTFPGKKGAL